jgi:hypothetical protein
MPTRFLSNFFHLGEIALLSLILLFARLHCLSGIPLHDFDAVQNFEIAKSAAEGDFSMIFTHASPVFHLLNAIFQFIFSDSYALLLLGSLFNTAGVFLCAAVFEKKMKKNDAPISGKIFRLAFILLFGLSPLMIYLSRCITNENLNFFLFSAAFYTFQTRKNISLTAFFLTTAVFVNYKILMIAPFLTLSFFQKPIEIRHLLRQSLLIFTAFALFFSLTGAILGTGAEQYLKNFAAIFLNKTKAAHSPLLQTDFSFYCRFLFETEMSFWAIFGILGAFFGGKKNYTGIIFIAFFIILHFLPKAPRALLFVLPVFYFEGIRLYFFVFEKLFLKIFYFKSATAIIFGIIVLISFIPAILSLQNNIYHYAQKSDFEEGAKILRQKNITQIYTLNSLQILPYAGKCKLVRADEKAVFKAGDVIFWDSYHLALNEFKEENFADFDTMYVGRQVLYLSPFLYFEHAEYNGLSYSDIKKNYKNVKKNEQGARWLLLKKK